MISYIFLNFYLDDIDIYSVDCGTEQKNELQKAGKQKRGISKCDLDRKTEKRCVK